MKPHLETFFLFSIKIATYLNGSLNYSTFAFWKILRQTSEMLTWDSPSCMLYKLYSRSRAHASSIFDIYFVAILCASWGRKLSRLGRHLKYLFLNTIVLFVTYPGATFQEAEMLLKCCLRWQLLSGNNWGTKITLVAIICFTNWVKVPIFALTQKYQLVTRSRS